jgi:hypothetical protein
MYVTWDPEDGTDKQTYEFDSEDMLRSEATAVEKHFGQPTDVWLDQLRGGSVKARAVLLWLLLRRDHPKIRFDDTPDFRLRQVKVEMSSSELYKLKGQVDRTKMDPDTREQLDAAFERDIADAIERETGVKADDAPEMEPLPKPL